MSGILTGIPQDSSKGTGGLDMTVYLAPKSAISGYTESVSATTKGYASFSSAAGVWAKYVFGKESASNYTVKGTGDVAKGSFAYEHTLTLNFRRNQNAKRNEVYVLAQNELVAAIKDNNGRYLILGGYRGLDLTQDESDSGNLLTDSNYNKITLVSKEPRAEFDIFPSKWANIVANTAVSAG